MRWVLWTVGILSALLGFLAPVWRVVSGVKGSGTPIVLASVVVTIVGAIVLSPRSFRYLWVAMLTQLAGLAVGASTAFLGIGLVQHKSMQVLLAVKWGLASCVLCYLALRETNQVEEHLKNQQLPPKPPDPNWEYVPESLGTLLHRQLLKLWPLVLFIVTATVVFLSSVYASQHAPR